MTSQAASAISTRGWLWWCRWGQPYRPQASPTVRPWARQTTTRKPLLKKLSVVSFQWSVSRTI